MTFDYLNLMSSSLTPICTKFEDIPSRRSWDILGLKDVEMIDMVIAVAGVRA